MATGLGNILDILIARIEGTTPTKDSNIRFRFLKRGIDTPQDRRFKLALNQIPLTMLPSTTQSANPFETELVFDFYYTKETEDYDKIKKIGQDAEDIFNRIHYLPGNDWGTSDGLDCIVIWMNLSEEDSTVYNLQIKVKLNYNITS